MASQIIKSFHGDTPHCIHKLPAPKELTEALPREILIVYITCQMIEGKVCAICPTASRFTAYQMPHQDISDKMLGLQRLHLAEFVSVLTPCALCPTLVVRLRCQLVTEQMFPLFHAQSSFQQACASSFSVRLQQ